MNAYLNDCWGKVMKVFKAAWLFLVLGFVVPSQAAVINVSPEQGAFEAAYAQAADGDTLLLQAGSYLLNGTSAFVVDKSITISSIALDQQATINFSFQVSDSTASGITVTLQGLRFLRDVQPSYEYASVGTDIVLLDNTFAYYSGPSLKGKRILGLGNHVNASVGSYWYCSELCYFGGNTFNSNKNSSNVTLSEAGVMYFVGNVVKRTWDGGSVSVDSDPLFSVSSSSASAYVYGNRFYKESAATSTAYVSAAISISGAGSVKNNIIELVHASPAAAVHLYGIKGNGLTIQNNVIRYADVSTLTTTATNFLGVFNITDSVAQGNILSGFDGTVFVNDVGSTYQYNLCPNAEVFCGDNAIIGDPGFVDTVDYKLASDSPAINKGQLGLSHFDLDNTRNDMGVYGGSLTIDQFDAQRAADFTGPYVYPMFSGSGAITEGQVAVKVISAAKLPIQ